MIPQHTIDRILSTARIEEVVGDFVDLKKRGTRYLGLCPFHDDRHLGNFVVYPRGNCYKCFSCDAKGGVVDFLMAHAKMTYPDAIRYLGKKYAIDTDMKEINYTPPPPRPLPPPLPTLTLPMQMVTSRQRLDDDLLVGWIRNAIRWDAVSRKRIDQMLADYHIGHSPKNGFTIFWQIDEEGKVRTGKMMKYRADGHRDRAAQYNFDFIHATLKRHRNERGEIVDEAPWPYPDIYDPDKQEMRQTLFGMHLLDRYGKDATIKIVESEKTALLMSIAYGNHTSQVWMACGGLENLSRERLAPIIKRGRRIILYPDRDGVNKWKQKAEQLHYAHLSVSTAEVTKWWIPEDGDKADIADIVLRYINGSRPITSLPEVVAICPQVQPLINKLNLEIEPNT